jgi:hypothetical protein
MLDREGEDGEIIPGAWRDKVGPSTALSPVRPSAIKKSPRTAYEVRSTLATYFSTEDNSVPWQMDYIARQLHESR